MLLKEVCFGVMVGTRMNGAERRPRKGSVQENRKLSGKAEEAGDENVCEGEE